MKIVTYLIILLSILFLQSCSTLRPPVNLSVSSDTRAYEFLQERQRRVISLKAELNIDPSAVASPSIDAYLSYDKEGVFRLVGLSPAGFTLFDIKVEDGVVSGPISSFPVKETLTPETLREVIDFYGSDNTGDYTWFNEETDNFYLVTQLICSGGMSNPVRRWWIDKSEMVIVKKELYSDIPDKHGVRIFEAIYSDFRAVNGMMTPYEIIINNGIGRKIGQVRFKKIGYNEVKK
ncbi:MAG TPA: hypothetical protein VFF47_08685 [Nitrospirota bacterium]|nr:hypothetical protein [Nitrospirota bacterium]